MEKDFEKVILKINKLIEKEKFEESYYNIRRLKNNTKCDQDIIDLLERKLNDSKKIKDLKERNLYDRMLEFKSHGKLNGYYDDYYTAQQYYTAGFYITGYVDFYYYLGVNYFRMGRQGEAVKMFKKYIKNGGYNKLHKAYRYLYRCYRIFNNKEKNEFLKLSNSYKRITMFLEDEQFNKVEYNFDEISIQDIINEFDSYENIKKLHALKYLYQKGNMQIADRLYKKYKNVFKEDKSVNKEHKKLLTEKTLYINQAKFSK